MTDQISSLLSKVSAYEESSNSNTSSNKTESKNSKKLTETKVDEDYFHIKLRKLFHSSVESSFKKMEIYLKDFFQDAQKFLDWVVEQKGITKNESDLMIDEIKDKLLNVDKIELDSFFINIPGNTIQ